jgi:hypothetical protein
MVEFLPQRGRTQVGANTRPYGSVHLETILHLPTTIDSRGFQCSGEFRSRTHDSSRAPPSGG